MPVASEPEEPAETKSHRVITWKPLFAKLKEVSLLPEPERTSRIVIDAKVGEVATITYYTFADDRLVDAFGVIREATPEEIADGKAIVK